MNRYEYNSTSQIFAKHIVGNATDTSREVAFVVTCPYCGIRLNKQPYTKSRYGCPNCGYSLNIRNGNL